MKILFTHFFFVVASNKINRDSFSVFFSEARENQILENLFIALSVLLLSGKNRKKLLFITKSDTSTHIQKTI